MANTFKIYNASAGSGKTYTLSKEYIALTLREQTPWAYRSILAVTFTNKATQEMKHRIMRDLQLIAEYKQDHFFNEVLILSGIKSADILVSRAQRTLNDILHNYSHFGVMTIDSFFQRVIRSFARDLGIHSGFALEFDQDRVLDEVVDEVLQDLSDDKQLQEWLLEFTLQNLEDARAWDIRWGIKKVGAEIFTERFKVSREKGYDKDQLRLIEKSLVVAKKGFDDVMIGYGELAKSIMSQHGLCKEDFKGASKSFVGIFDAAINGVYKYTATQQKAVGEVENWYKAKSPNESAIVDAFNGGLNECLQNIISSIDTKLRYYITTKGILNNIYTYGILQDLRSQLSAYKKENEIMLGSDMVDLLNQIIKGSDALFVYEKIGTKFKHYLIDEFQDTSTMQWTSMLPLIAESLDGDEDDDHTSMIVGDVKQAIYRWRGGDMDLLLEQAKKDIGGYRVQEFSLDSNFRSAKGVVEFNNLVFDNLPKKLVSDLEMLMAKSALSDAEKKEMSFFANRINTAYKDAHQIPQLKQEGYVQINTVKKKEDALRVFVEEQLPLVTKEYALSDITILVRTANNGAEVVEAVNDYKREHPEIAGDFKIITTESLFLDSSEVVRCILDAIRYIHNPLNSVAKFGIAYALEKLKGKSGALENTTIEIPDFIERGRGSLAKKSIYSLVEELILKFEFNEKKDHLAYLIGLQDAVLEFSKQKANSLALFVEWWEEYGIKRSVKTTSSKDGMNIMTIHKSKGLEFKVLMIPLCSWGLDHYGISDNYIWPRPSGNEMNEGYQMPVKYMGELANSTLSKEYFEERTRAYLDNLNLLYVAFTRAKECMFVNCIKDRAPISVPIIDLIQSQKEYDTEKDVYIKGNLEKAESQEEVSESIGLELSEYSSSQWQNQLRIKNSFEEVKGIFDDTRTDKINEGIIVHELLARVITPKQIKSSIQSLILEGIIEQKTFGYYLSVLEKVISHPQVQDWFDTDKYTIKTEVPVLPGTGELKRLDRVLINGDEAIVIDYKTGKEKDRDASQVEEYKDLLLGMGYKNVKGFLYYIVEEKVEQV